MNNVGSLNNLGRALAISTTLILGAVALSACGSDRRGRADVSIFTDSGTGTDAPGVDGGTDGGRDGVTSGCTTAAECDDGVSCTVDTCTAGSCSNVADDAMCPAGQTCEATGCMAACNDADCADADPCTSNERCMGGVCVSDVTDADDDGAPSMACGGGDCDDMDPAVGPGRPEICDNKDNNCDGVFDGPMADAACGAGSSCIGGSCGCAGGLTSCGGACIDTSTDRNNCGRCGMVCPGGGACSLGSCAPVCVDASACTAVRGCPGGAECVAEVDGTIGGAADPITGFSGTIESDSFVNGYCTSAGPAAGACDVDTNVGCSSCSQCLVVSEGATAAEDLQMCLRTCTRSLTSRGGCEAGQACLVNQGVCFDGCQNNDECRVERHDTSGDGVPDTLMYDRSSRAVCDAATSRCTNPGTFGAEAGDTCTWDRDCESGGRCIQEWAGGGYCVKDACDLPGNGCSGSGNCEDFGGGAGTCLAGCRVGAESVSERTGIFGNGLGCRTNYGCTWNGADRSGTNGYCAPSEYNSVTINNVGATCTDDSQCYSPYGRGVCVEGWGTSGMCVITACSDPGLASNVCGTGNTCEDIGAGTDVCLETCTTATSCGPGVACTDHDGSVGTARVCSPVCTTSSDCRSGETCGVDNTCS